MVSSNCRDENKRAAGNARAETLFSEGLPSDDELLVIVDAAREEAVWTAQLLGMNPEIEACIPCPLEYLRSHKQPPPFSLENPVGTQLVEAAAQGGGERTLNAAEAKTTIWSLSDKQRQSSDRLLRVHTGISSGLKGATELFPRRATELKVSDWCVFYLQKEIVIGQVLSFKYLTGIGSAAKYNLRSAPVQVPEGCQARGLGVHCALFQINVSGKIEYRQTPVKSFPIETYILHLPAPEKCGNEFQYNENLCKYFNLVPNSFGECSVCENACIVAYVRCICHKVFHVSCLEARPYNDTVFECEMCEVLNDK